MEFGSVFRTGARREKRWDGIICSLELVNVILSSLFLRPVNAASDAFNLSEIFWHSSQTSDRRQPPAIVHTLEILLLRPCQYHGHL